MKQIDSQHKEHAREEKLALLMIAIIVLAFSFAIKGCS